MAARFTVLPRGGSPRSVQYSVRLTGSRSRSIGYGIYEIRREAFTPATETAEIRSALPASKSIQLQIAAVSPVRSLLGPHCVAEFAAVARGSPK
jgi:hypothetical protein